MLDWYLSWSAIFDSIYPCLLDHVILLLVRQLMWMIAGYMLQAVDAVLETSEGDMRKAITTLQSAARLKGKDGVTKADVVEVAGVIVLYM